MKLTLLTLLLLTFSCGHRGKEYYRHTRYGIQVCEWYMAGEFCTEPVGR